MRCWHRFQVQRSAKKKMRKIFISVFLVSLFFSIFCCFSLSFPITVLSENAGMAFGFPLPWHASGVTSESRSVWLPGLIANILVVMALSTLIVVFVKRRFLRARPSGILVYGACFTFVLISVLLALVFLANFLDPYISLKQPYEFFFKDARLHIGPFF